MKIKKIVLLILTILVLTGCTSQVNITISEDNLEEEIIIDDQISPISLFREYMPVYNKDYLGEDEPDTKYDGVEYYKREIANINGTNRIKYSYKYPIEEYTKSKTMRSIFKSSGLTTSDREGYITLYTSSDGLLAFDKYPGLTNLTINITTDLEMVENNADSANGNTYTWNYTPNNNSKNIYIQVKNSMYRRLHPDEYPESPDNKKDDSVISIGNKKNNNKEQRKLFNIILIILALAGFVITIILVNKFNIKKNS